MTGITSVSKESVFSNLNHLKVVTTTSEEYADSFGFTEEEVFAGMDEFGYAEKEKVKLWYDGFVFGSKKDIYNPWSILNYLDTGKLTTYWANTSSNSLVGNVKAMGNYMNRMSLKIFSYFDTGKQPSEAEPERFYHGFVLGLLVELAGRYVITSNRESGFGRYDVMLEPLNKEDCAYILEFKVHDRMMRRRCRRQSMLHVCRLRKNSMLLLLSRKVFRRNVSGNTDLLLKVRRY